MKQHESVMWQEVHSVCDGGGRESSLRILDFMFQDYELIL